MRTRAFSMIAVAALLGATFALVPSHSDAAQRNCQTLLTCNYAKGGSYRGCLSSYSCRSCRFVPARCQIGNSTGKCQKMVCDWSGT